MDYRILGRSGLRVSRLCLGTMDFGDTTDEATAERLVEVAGLRVHQHHGRQQLARQIDRLVALRKAELLRAGAQHWLGDLRGEGRVAGHDQNHGNVIAHDGWVLCY